MAISVRLVDNRGSCLLGEEVFLPWTPALGPLHGPLWAGDCIRMRFLGRESPWTVAYFGLNRCYRPPSRMIGSGKLGLKKGDREGNTLKSASGCSTHAVRPRKKLSIRATGMREASSQGRRFQHGIHKFRPNQLQNIAGWHMPTLVACDSRHGPPRIISEGRCG